MALLYLKTTNPDQDETETRLSKIEANETRPGQDYPTVPKYFIRDETSSKNLYEVATYEFGTRYPLAWGYLPTSWDLASY